MNVKLPDWKLQRRRVKHMKPRFEEDLVEHGVPEEVVPGKTVPEGTTILESVDVKKTEKM